GSPFSLGKEKGLPRTPSKKKPIYGFDIPIVKFSGSKSLRALPALPKKKRVPRLLLKEVYFRV
ncbi:MAG: hypothetical protein IJC54_07740, partial [Clostridia bacterium]|nr:hypothetical protein [Clostridia bacterium]